MQIPTFRDPLRDAAEGIQSGMDNFARGLMIAGQQKEKSDQEARISATQMKGAIAEEIARLTAVDTDDPQKQERLQQLRDLNSRVEGVFAANRQGGASQAWASVMSQGGAAATVGAASGAATAMEFTAAERRRIDEDNRVRGIARTDAEEARARQNDVDARVGAGNLKGSIAQEIARLTSVPQTPETAQQLEMLMGLNDRLQAVFAATELGDAHRIYSSVMSGSNVAPTLGAASGAATSAERELESTRAAEQENAQILRGFVAFLSGNPREPGFIDALGSQLALIEGLVNGGFVLPASSQRLLEALPEIIGNVRGALGSDPEFQRYMRRVNALEDAAVRKVTNEVGISTIGLVEAFQSTGIVPEGSEETLRNALGLSPEAFEVERQSALKAAGERRAAAATATSLNNRLLSASADEAEHNVTVAKYRSGREQILDAVNDAKSASDLVSGAILSGDTQMLSLILRELDDPTNPARAQWWRAAGLTSEKVESALAEAGVSVEYRRLSMETAREGARRALNAAVRGVVTDPITERVAIIEMAGRGVASSDVESWFDSLSASEQSVLMGPGGSRDATVLAIKQQARLNELAVSQPLRADALSRVSSLLSLPVPGAVNGVLSGEAMEIMAGRAFDIYEILAPEFGENFAAQFQLGAQELMGRGAKLWEWELYAEEWRAKLLQAQAQDAASSAAARGRAGAGAGAGEPFNFKPYRDGISDSMDALGATIKNIITLQEQNFCIDYMDTGPGVAVRVLANPTDPALCAEYADRLTQLVSLNLVYAQEMDLLRQLQFGAGFGGVLSPPPAETPPPPPPPPAGPAPAPAAPASTGAATPAPAPSAAAQRSAANNQPAAPAPAAPAPAAQGTPGVNPRATAGAAQTPPVTYGGSSAAARSAAVGTPPPAPVNPPRPAAPAPAAPAASAPPASSTPPQPNATDQAVTPATENRYAANFRPAQNQSAVAPHVRFGAGIAGAGRDTWWWEDPAFEGYDFLVTVRDPNGRERRVQWSSVVSGSDRQWEVVAAPPEPTVPVVNPQTGEVTDVPFRQAVRLGWGAAR